MANTKLTILLLLLLISASILSIASGEDLAESLENLNPREVTPSNLLWLTFMIAGMDSVNPCAFYILTFLLSILIYARDRLKIMLVGGIFVFFSGFCYFLFMAAWLNALVLLSEFKPIIWIIMIFVMVAGALNIKEYLMPGSGPSLGVSEKGLSRIGRSAKRLLTFDSIPSLAISASILAFTVNLYELVCTPGFPMVYVSLLSTLGLSPSLYYLYLILYNVVYVLPLLAIVLVFAYTLGRMRFSDIWARRIKLFSGYLMIGLALAMLLKPWLLIYLETTLQLLASAFAATIATIIIYEHVLRRR